MHFHTNSVEQRLVLRQRVKATIQSLIHLFWSFSITSLFWQEFRHWITANHENVTSNFSSLIVLALRLFSLARKPAFCACVFDITFGFVELKRSLSDWKIS